MPNHCSNFLNVKVSDETEEALMELADFKKKTTRVDDDGEMQFTMSIIDPTPEELLDQEAFNRTNSHLMEKYGHAGWYTWRVENWGTKWDAYETVVHSDFNNEYEVSYDTAWAPNIPFMIKASEEYPKLIFTLRYEEPGMGFCGKCVISKGLNEEQQGDLLYVDDDGEEVVFDQELFRYKYAKTGEILHEDFYPNHRNPY